MRKRVGIDARLINQTGVGIYTRNLLGQLEDIADNDIEFHIYLRSADIDSITFKKSNFIKAVADHQWHTFNEQIFFASILNSDKLDLMHFTYFSYPFMYTRPFIITIHDLTPYFFATGQASTKNMFTYRFKHLAYKFLTRTAVRNSQAIITPTQKVKNDITSVFGEHLDDKIHVTYEGVDEKLKNVKPNNDLKKKYKKPFYIYVGNFYPHKNIEALIKAYSDSTIKEKLILIGPKDFFSSRIKSLVTQLGLRRRILMLHDISQEDLVFFYKNARALIHPTLTEGFGLPLLEARHFGCPIIASDIDVFEETFGDTFTSFDPLDTDDIRKTIEGFTVPKKKNTTKSTFSFNNMTKQTYKIYKNNLKG